MKLSILLIQILYSINVYANDIVLGIGYTEQIAIEPKQKVILSNSSLLHIKDKHNSLQLTGKKLGSSQIQIGSINYNFSVIDAEQFRNYQVINTQLQSMRGLQIKVQNQCLSLQGRLLRWQDWYQISKSFVSHKKSNSSKCQLPYSFDAFIEPSIADEVKNNIQEDLQKNQLAHIKIEIGPPLQIYSLGKDKDQDEIKNYQTFLDKYGLSLKVRKNLIDLQAMLELELIIAEVKRSEMHQLGLDWPTKVQLAKTSASNTESDNLILTANFLESKGIGKVLASPKLLSQNNKEAIFVAGGEFPIKVKTKTSYSISWKSYGLSLKILPVIDQMGQFQISVTAEISTIDDSTSVDDIPGILSNKVESHFNLDKEKSIVLSGLIKQEWGKANSGIALLNKIPILGSLFSSESFRQSKTELVIIVNPVVRWPNQEWKISPKNLSQWSQDLNQENTDRN